MSTPSAHDLALAARPHVPAPNSVSDAARAYLSREANAVTPDFPPRADAAAWRELVHGMNQWVSGYYESYLPDDADALVSSFTLADVTTFVLRPGDVDADSAPLFIEIHGGGLFMGAGDLAWKAAYVHAMGRDGITWAPDYRMPPDHPFPAALDDLVAVYRRALSVRPPERIVVSGASGGGNLAAAFMLRAKDEGLPMPAALVLLTPEIDLTESGDSFATNLGIDPGLTPLMPVNLLYAGGEALDHPYISPLFGDVTGFPPTLLQTGTRDLYLSNTVRMHHRLVLAGVPAELHVGEAMGHGGFDGHTPEDVEMREIVREFERRKLAEAGTP